MKVFANFKMYKTRKETIEYLDNIKYLDKGEVEVNIFVPFTCFIENDFVGAQNAFPAVNGAFTGEIGLEQLNEFNIKKILIGHSERRNILNESQDFIKRKFDFYKQHNFEITYCIGEDLVTRTKGLDSVIEVLKSQLDGIDLDYDKLTIAYEPVWAIGTGKSASLEDIYNTHSEIRKFTSKDILYGGSVKLNNIKEILLIDNVDGVLVGSASLNFEIFKEMILIAKDIKKD